MAENEGVRVMRAEHWYRYEIQLPDNRWIAGELYPLNEMIASGPEQALRKQYPTTIAYKLEEIMRGQVQRVWSGKVG